MSQPTQRITDNVASVLDRIDQAARRSGRTGAEIRLVAVSKYVSSDVTRCLFQAGCHDLGESRPQQLWDKALQLSDLAIRWHFIGHLQRNKAARTLSHVTCLHSLDSVRLIRAVQQSVSEADRCLDALIELNVSGDSAKHGFLPDQIADAVGAARECDAISIRGLMAMASAAGGLKQARQNFQQLRRIRDECVQDFPDLQWGELSMGMSNDFEIAIEEGATVVRVGSALFEGVDRSDRP